METEVDYGDEPVRKDLGMLLVLVAACPFGLLMWFGLCLAIQWTVIATWAVAVAAGSTITVTTPALASLVPVHAAGFRSDPSASFGHWCTRRTEGEMTPVVDC
jgi:hypothetical protein